MNGPLKLIFWFLCHNTAFGQGIDFQQRLDSLLTTKKYAPNAAGISFCVKHKGKIVYERCFGLANIKKQIPVTASTKFNMASITKQFTACCILILESEGKLSRADSIQRYLPELPSFGHTITLNHLLAHSSGIPDHLEVLGLQNNYTRKRLNPDWVLKFLQQHPFLSFPPGERFAYCNTGYMLLSMIVERLSGRSFSEFAEQRIFGPLQMNQSCIAFREHEGLGDSTLSYYLDKQKLKVESDPEPNAIGATGLFGTTRDLMLWQAALDRVVLPKAADSVLRQMQQSYYLNDAGSAQYGPGLILKPYRGYLSREHAGGWNNFLVQCKGLPELELSVIVASNSTANSPFLVCDQICDLFLPNSATARPLQTQYAKLLLPPSAFVGTYIDPGNVVRQVKLTQDTLTLNHFEPSSKSITKLYYQGSQGDSLQLFVDDQRDTVQFKVDRNGRAKGFYWEGGHYFRYKRYYEKLDDVPSSAIKACADTYRSKIFAQKLRFSYSTTRQRLKMFPVFYKGYALQHIGGLVFKLLDDSIFIRFTPGGLILGNDWVSGLPFERK